ncbi:MAG: glycosyltransferase family 2 protein [Ignavibacteriales bacterium]|nr:glycosyltransferase family 2 protein [Ignavibacteriales bacterium]
MKTTRTAKKVVSRLPEISVVVPVFNEEETLGLLVERLVAVLEKMTKRYEVLFVNDGSRDRTYELLIRHAAANQNLRVVDFSRNFGHQTAVAAGLSYAAGDAVIVMDGDLQDPPELLPEFVEKWREGYEVVYAVRAERKENIFKRTAYKMFYRALHALADIDIPLDSGDFGLMDRRVVDAINRMPERNRFVRGLRSWVGFRQVGLPYSRDARFAGDSKYPLTKLMKLAFDGLISFSTAPLKIATAIGFLVSFCSFVGILFYLYLFFTTPRVPGFTTLIIILLFIGGVQLITVGILGEYVGRIYDESKHRPMFVVRETINIQNDREFIHGK